MSEIDTDRREHLIYDGVCPICGEEFIDGYGSLEENQSYEARICVDEIGDGGEGKMLVHLPNVDPSTTDTERPYLRDCEDCEMPLTDAENVELSHGTYCKDCAFEYEVGS